MVRMTDDIKSPNEDSQNEEGTLTDHSIRNVAPLETHERESRRAKRAERRRIDSKDTDASMNRRKQSFLSRYGVWAIATIVLVLALSAVGFVFIGKTTIAIIPQQEVINLSPNVVYTAYKNAQEGELGYTLFTHTLEATDAIPATGRETVEEKASGKIVVYNNHSSAPQRLIKNTRFEAPSGEIYRVRNSIVVPGMKSDETPGSIEITVYADKAGEDQNITAIGTRFSIPGLKGDPRYDTFHAELSAPIIGGFVGERAIVDEDILNASQTRLRNELTEKISSTVVENIPESHVFFGSDAVFSTFESMPVTYADGDIAQVKEALHIYAVIFDENEVARMLATTALATPSDGKIRIDNSEALAMSVVNKEGVDIINDALIQFTIEGRSPLTWEVDVEALKQDLVGKHSEALNTVMSGYPGIKSAQATIRPFWKNEFPTETGGISVDILPEN